MSLDIRRYFITAVDPETGEPVVTTEIKAPCFSEAMERADWLARYALGGRRGRITSVTEQPEAHESFFLRQTAHIAGERLQISSPS